MKEKYEAQAGEIRKNISVAKAEMEKYKTNKETDKKEGKKIEQNYLTISSCVSVRMSRY